MRVLVTYASRHGATAGIAERIGAVLADEGIIADVKSVADAQIMERGAHLERYDAFIVGSAVYAFHLLADATDFVRRNAELLATRPVWLFGSGPLGDSLTDDKGKDVRTPPPQLVDLAERIDALETRVFFGAYDASDKPIGMLERVARLAPATRDLLKTGDYRDWDEIESWARAIAGQLKQVTVAV